VISVVQQLSASLVYTEPTNFDTNKKLWNEYSKDWDPQQPWVQNMESNINLFRPNNDQHREQEGVPHCLGDEWSDSISLRQVLDEFLFPYLNKDKVVGEIGSGGGRIAIRVAPLVKELWCFDIAEEMLKRCQNVLFTHFSNNISHLKFQQLSSNTLPLEFDSYFDFLYCFDVLVHVDLHSQWQYFSSISRALKPGGLCFLSVADITSRGGWDRFSKQKKYTAGGFYFTSPQIIEKLANEANFEFVHQSKPDPANLYYDRDFLFVLRKKAS